MPRRSTRRKFGRIEAFKTRREWVSVESRDYDRMNAARVFLRGSTMKKLTAWLLLVSIYFSFIAPVNIANAQVIGKAMEQRLKDVPGGLKFRLSEGVEGAEARTKAQLPRPIRCRRATRRIC